MANLKVKLEGKKIAEKVMEFMDEYSFDPIYNEIEKNGDDTYISEILRCFPTRRIINDLDERGELHEAYKEYVDMNGVTLVKDMAKRMTNKEKTRTCIGTFQNTIPGKPGRIRGSDSESSKRTILQIINNH